MDRLAELRTKLPARNYLISAKVDEKGKDGVRKESSDINPYRNRDNYFQERILNKAGKKSEQNVDLIPMYADNIQFLNSQSRSKAGAVEEVSCNKEGKSTIIKLSFTELNNKAAHKKPDFGANEFKHADSVYMNTDIVK